MLKERYRAKNGKLYIISDGRNEYKPIKNQRDGVFELIKEIKEQAYTDYKRYKEGLCYLGDGRGYNKKYKNKIKRHNPIKEWDNSYIKDALDRFNKIVYRGGNYEDSI